MIRRAKRLKVVSFFFETGESDCQHAVYFRRYKITNRSIAFSIYLLSYLSVIKCFSSSSNSSAIFYVNYELNLLKLTDDFVCLSFEV